MNGRRIAVSLVLAVVFLALVRWISGVRFSDILSLVRESRLDYLGLALAAYTVSYCTRAFRFKILLRSEAPSFSALFSIAALHNLFNATLPARTGELSYIYLVRKRHQVSTAAGSPVSPALWIATSVSPPPTIVSAWELATQSTIAMVPRLNASISKTPMGPFHTTVLAS